MKIKQIQWKHSDAKVDGYIDGHKVCVIEKNTRIGGYDLAFYIPGLNVSSDCWRESLSELKETAQRRLEKKIQEFIEVYCEELP